MPNVVMMKNIHWEIIKRLFLGWILLSAVLSAGVYYYELRKVDHTVLGLAIEESVFFTRDLAKFNVGQPAESLQGKADQFLKRHFVAIALYDADRHLVFQAVNSQAPFTAQKARDYFPSRIPLPFHDHLKRVVNGHLYLQVTIPIRGRTEGTQGYFEGVYRVGDRTLHNLEFDVTSTLVLVVLVILMTAVVLYPVILLLNRGLLRTTTELLKGNIELMDVLGSAIAKRDSDTNSHNYRVTIYAIRLAEAIGMANDGICRLISGAFLHDVGKIGIRDHILLKPGRLTDSEFAVMQNHVRFGVEIIDKSAWLKGAREVVEFHHEKYDGTGYMKGLRGDEIPLNARIFTIVDVFDALTSKRPYKEPFSYEESMRVLQQDSGKRFDPFLLETFIGIAKPLHASLVEASDESLMATMHHLVDIHFSVSGAHQGRANTWFKRGVRRKAVI